MKKATFFFFLLICGTLMAQQPNKVEAIKAKADAGDVDAMVTMGRILTNGLYKQPFDSVQAFQYFQKAAQAGSADAKSHLSRFYLWSTLVPIDTAKYIALLQEAHNQGSLHATSRLGQAYLKGIGVEKNEKLGKKYTELAYKNGSAYACYRLGLYYQYGDCGYELNKAKANQYFIESIKKGEIVAYDMLLDNLLEAGDCEQFLYWINQAKELDYLPVNTTIARAYIQGKCFEADTAKGIEMLRELNNLYPTDYGVGVSFCDAMLGAPYFDTAGVIKACQKGIEYNAEWANLELGYIYKFSDQTSQYHNPSLADSYFDKIWKSSPFACYQIGIKLFTGDSPFPTAHSIEVLLHGINEFHDTICTALLEDYYLTNGDTASFVKYATIGARYHSQEGISELRRIYAAPQNEKFFRSAGNTDFRDLMKEFIAQGDNNAYYQLALLEDSRGNTAKAIQHLEKGFKKENTACGLLLANCYRKGIEMKANPTKADKIYASINTGVSTYQRAIMRLNGEIPAKSLNEVLPYLQQSADMHYLPAFIVLGNIYMDEDLGVMNPDVALGYFRRLAQEENGKAEGYWRIANFYEYRLSSDLYGHDNSDTANMIKYYTLAAEAGSADGWGYLGDIYLDGTILPADTNKAFEYIKKAAAMDDNPKGLYMLGKYHLNGFGTPIDTALAVSYFLTAAEKGVGKACAYLGDFHKLGLAGFTPDYDSALYYYNIGSQSDDPTCDYELGQFFFTSKHDYERAIPYIQSALKNGNLKANILLSQYYLNGILTQQNTQKAIELLENAAQAGFASAYTELGSIYLRQDLNKAYLYLDTASQMNDPKGEFYLGQFLLIGLGCDKDTVKALQLIDHAARSGWFQASNYIGDYYEQQEDYAKAVEYYELGVFQQSLQSYCNLGYCYEKGQGVVLNSQKAFELYMTAAEHNFGLGCFRVAMCYMEGTYVEENILKTEEWLVKGAATGHGGCAYYLGMIYERGEQDDHGNAVKADKKKAIQYYQMASEAGVEAATSALDRIKGKSK